MSVRRGTADAKARGVGADEKGAARDANSPHAISCSGYGRQKCWGGAPGAGWMFLASSIWRLVAHAGG